MKKIIFLISFILCAHISMAQQSSIKGTVIDENDQEPLEYATVALYMVKDSSLVKGTTTDASGFFNLQNLSRGNYYLRIQFMGYDTYQKKTIKLEKSSEIALGKVGLLPNDAVLEGVTVEGKQSKSYHQIDRQVYNADQFQSSQGGTATDVIKNMPSITVNAQGEISVRGSSGFVVLLNDQPVQMDPSVILNQLPANAVENVEIITAPSAKYDPEGKAGIINIKTKKGKTDGVYLLVNANYGLPSIEPYDNAEKQKRGGGDFTLSYRKGKWDISLGADYNRDDVAGRRDGHVWTRIGDTLTIFPSNGERSFDKKNYSVRTTIGFNPDKQNNFSAGFYAGKRTKWRTADILYDQRTIYEPEDETVSTLNYYNENLRARRGDFLIGSFDYSHAFDNNSALKTSFLYEHTLLGGPTTNINTIWPAMTDTIQHQYNTNDNPLDGIRFKADYSKPVGNGQFEMGYQFRNLVHIGDFFYEERNIGTNNWDTLDLFTNSVDLKRSIHSAYGQYSGKTNKLSYTGGLRLEMVDRELSTGQRNQPYRYDYLKLFPSANLMYEFGNGLKLKSAYSSRVERTTTFKMNPFPEREHSETFEQGDAELLPEFIDIVELGIVKEYDENSLFATAYYQHTENLINRVNNVYNDSILNRIYTNAGDARKWGFEAGMDFNITDWWHVYAGGNIFNYKIEGTLFGDVINTTSNVFSINANTTFEILPSLSLQWNLNYISDRITAQGEDSRYLSPNLTITKSFMDDQLSASLQWHNMDMGFLPTNEQRITTSGDDYYTTTNYIYEVDVLRLNLSYRINQLDKKLNFTESEFGEREF